MYFKNFNLKKNSIYIANHNFIIGAKVGRKEAYTGAKDLMMFKVGYIVIRRFFVDFT